MFVKPAEDKICGSPEGRAPGGKPATGLQLIGAKPVSCECEKITGQRKIIMPDDPFFEYPYSNAIERRLSLINGWKPDAGIPGVIFVVDLTAFILANNLVKLLTNRNISLEQTSGHITNPGNLSGFF
jgi:hypothetical protein